MYIPSAANLGPQQIWPALPLSGASIMSTRYFRAYYELLNNFRVSLAQPLKPTEFYAYHPLTATDSSAFDGIALDVGFYEFMEGRIDLKKSISSYFGEDEENKKKIKSDL